MAYRKLLLLKHFEKDEDKDDEEDLPSCPDVCYAPCSGCMMEKDTILVYPVLPPPSPPASSPNHTTSVLVLIACLLGFSFIIVSYLLVTRYRMRLRNSRRRNSDSLDGDSFREDFIDGNHGPVVDHPIWLIRTVGLSQSVIDSISIVGYKKGEGLIEGSDCSVCLSEFEEDESLRLLPKCSHAFHVHCIDTWLRAHKNCPVCRAPIVAGEGNASPENPEETSSDNLGHEEENGVESLNDIEEEEGGTSGILVENGSPISFPFDERLSENELPGKNSGSRYERGKRDRVKSDFVENRVMMVVNETMEPKRRSISMDAGSVSLIDPEMTSKLQVKGEGPSDLNMAIEMKQISGSRSSRIYSKMTKSSSIGRSLQKVNSSVKRSFSSGRRSSLVITEKPQVEPFGV